jgi:hypothetical protein
MDLEIHPTCTGTDVEIDLEWTWKEDETHLEIGLEWI